MSNLLKDYLPDAPREKSILVAAAEAGLADTLREHVAQGMDPNTAIRLTASSFSSSTPFTPEACNWVTDEIAIALGITQPGSGSGGQMGGTPPGFAPLPGEGMPTQMAGGSPGGFGGQPGQSPGGGQAFGQSPAGANPQEQPTAQGYRPGYGPGQPGQPAQPGGYPGQAGTPAPGYPGGQTAAPGLGGAQTAGPGFPGQQAYPGQPGFPGQQGTPGGWQPGGFGPGAPVNPYQGGGSGGQGGSRRGLLVGGGIAVLVIIVIIAVFVFKSGPSTSSHVTNPTPTVTRTATSSPTSTGTAPPTTGVEPLTTIMNPPGLTPVGTDCSQALLFGLNKSTLKSRIFCAKTGGKDTVVWGYQFFNHSQYLAGVTEINKFTGFSKTVDGCPPSSSTADGETGWHANSNSKYAARPGQDIECFIDNKDPVLIWTMPTMNAFFIGQDREKGSTNTTVLAWWKTLNYG
ncbi:MAG TPA: hypothetical protein VMR14_12545 [Streptosporangiaceae bacterium]|jgi:hypothetical protein|nr:hypothetical protein [Streptosporangiaceae bacterium]